MKSLLKKIAKHVSIRVLIDFKIIFTNRQDRTTLNFFKPKKVLKRPIVNAFPGVVLLVWKLVLMHLKVLSFSSKFSKY